MPILEGKPEEIKERLAAVSLSRYLDMHVISGLPGNLRTEYNFRVQKWQPTLVKNWTLFIPVQCAK